MSLQEDSIIFKQKLYENFKQSGLLNRLQTTLRANLLQKIQKPSKDINSEMERLQLQREQSSKAFYLRKKFIDNIIHDYLQKKKMQYTISIFLPESNLGEKDVINFDFMTQITNIPRYQSEDSNESFLQCLLDEWMRKSSIEKRQRYIQTDIESETVGRKLERIQQDYMAKIDYWKLIPNKQVSDNPTLFEHEQKLKAKFQVQKQKLKLDTQRAIRAQMQRKFQSQYEFRLTQISKDHEKRIQQLKSRQKLIMQSLQRKKKQIQQKAKDLSTRQFELIKKYETRQKQIQSYYKKREMDIETREKEFWKRELEVKAKKRQYEDAIRLVKQKAIGEAGEMPSSINQGGTYLGKTLFYQ